jgi:hypothetical protein
MTVHATQIRYRVDPGDVPPEKAARRLHLTPERFEQLLPKLLERGFPPADPDTGMYGLDAIDEWRHGRDRITNKLASRSQNERPSPRAESRWGDRIGGKRAASRS